MGSRTGLRLIAVATALAAAILVAFASMVVTGIKPELFWPNEAFTSTNWLASPKEMRFRYVKNLLQGDELRGKSRSEVVEVLGPPSTEYGGRFTTYTVAYPWDFALTLDSVYFVRIEFDRAGRFVRATLESD